ncbi:hypothetical protein KIN20_035429 [Parelaphostrongylus tenuis]|uniref:Uncharacterized protein n=1 Tax=Parelaphostrongylus tenuis TaxID=148309 RepID=A0AAD5RB56_PARTN|nr:hypothetical protein KIN20_035429 [Parelaphostrongylus tenuis]
MVKMRTENDSPTTNPNTVQSPALTRENGDRTNTSDLLERRDMAFSSDESGISQDKCEDGYSQVQSSEEPKGNERSFSELIDSLSLDIDSFSEAVDELESMSESIQSLVRNAVIGDGRPTGAWKDLC